MGGLSGRHGSGAGARVMFSRGERERDRPRARSVSLNSRLNGDSRAQATAYRSTPAGPQEEQDWSNALENILSRVMGIESMQRKHAQSIAACEISTMGADGKLTKISTAELFPADGTTVMFGVPGAFTPG